MNIKNEQPAVRRKNRHSNSFRDQIIRYLHDEKGLSWPQAEKVFKAVWRVITRCVRRGEAVELPGVGTLVLVGRKSEGGHRWWCRHYNIHTGEWRYKLVHSMKHKRRIVFIPDPGLDLTPPPTPPSPAEIEARQLVAELLGQPVNDWTTAHLQQIPIDPNFHRPGALLRRLRELKRRGRTFSNVTSLAYALAELYWI